MTCFLGYFPFISHLFILHFLFALQIQVHTEALNIRVSYHDTQLFLGIMNSLPEQLKQVSVNAIEKELQSAIERTSPQDKYKQKQRKYLNTNKHEYARYWI